MVAGSLDVGSAVHVYRISAATRRHSARVERCSCLRKNSTINCPAATALAPRGTHEVVEEEAGHRRRARSRWWWGSSPRHSRRRSAAPRRPGSSPRLTGHHGRRARLRADLRRRRHRRRGTLPARQRRQGGEGLHLRLQGARRRQERPATSLAEARRLVTQEGVSRDRARGLGGHARRLPHASSRSRGSASATTTPTAPTRVPTGAGSAPMGA